MKKRIFLINLLVVLAVSLSAGFFISTKIYHDQWQGMMNELVKISDKPRMNIIETEVSPDSLEQSSFYNLNNQVWLIAVKKTSLAKNIDILNKIHFDQDFIGYAVVVTNDGWLMSKNDIKGLKDLVIIDNKNIIYDVEEIFEDSILGITYLKINQNSLQPIAIGDSDFLEIGQSIYLIKPNLYNYQNEIILNSIRNLHSRFIKNRQDLIHQPKDVVIYGLLNDYLEQELPIIDPNAHFVGFSVNFDNQTYLLPSKYIRYSLNQFFNKNEIVYPSLGISYINLSEVVIDADYPNKGVLVYKILDKKSDFQEGDIITEIGSDELNEINSLNTILLDYDIGDNLDIKLLRNGIIKDTKYIIRALNETY